MITKVQIEITLDIIDKPKSIVLSKEKITNSICADLKREHVYMWIPTDDNLDNDIRCTVEKIKGIK